MKAWIIGANGMLGTAFLNFLSAEKIEVKGTDILDVDITQPLKIKDFLKEHSFDYWINCAAYTQVDQAEEEEEKAYLINKGAVENLIDAATEQDTPPKIIHFSTDYVFDGTKETPYTESDTPSPLSIYGKSKYESEEILSKYPEHLIFRLSWLFGATGKNFVKTMLQLMSDRESLSVIDDQIGRPTYADDAAEAAWKLRDQTGTYHLCNSDPTTWHGFAQEIAQQAQSLELPIKLQLLEAVTSEEYLTKAIRPKYSVLDTSKIEKSLSLRPWQEALSDCLMQITKRSI